MSYKKLQIRRGLKANIPTLAEGELGFCTDTKDIYVGDGSTNTLVGGDSLSATIDTKVAKVDGKDLSTNDYTDADKAKLDGIAESATANTVLTMTGTISKSDWDWENLSEYSAKTRTSTELYSYYTKTVSVTGILATDTPIIDLVVTIPTRDNTTEVFDEEQESWGKIIKAECYDGGITFYASERPSINLNFQVKVVR